MRRNRLRVLTYHRVRDGSDGSDVHQPAISATPEVFERQMRHLARHYRVVRMEEVLHATRTGRPLPRRAVLVTFDDAYADFGEIAWPILRRCGVPATLFVPTAYPDCPAREFWWERLSRASNRTSRPSIRVPGLGDLSLGTPARRRTSLSLLFRHLKEIPNRESEALVEALCRELDAEGRGGRTRVLTWEQLRELARDGVSMGAHTRTHPLLTRTTPDEARAEITGSRDDLRRELGDAAAPVFAYPSGAHGEQAVELVREAGFELAFTCIEGHNRLPGTDPLRLRRTGVTRRTTPTLLRLRLQGWFSHVDRWRRGVRSRTRGGDAVGSGPGRPARSRASRALVPKFGPYRSHYLCKALDAVLTSRPGAFLRTDPTRTPSAEAGSPSYRRARRAAGLADSLLPGPLTACLERSFNTDHLPFRTGSVELLSFGSGWTVFLAGRARAEAPALVLKIRRKSLGMRLGTLKSQARGRRQVYDTIARWYEGSGVVLPTHFMILHGPLLAGPAVACVQPFVSDGAIDLFHDREEDDLVRMLLDHPALRRQFCHFVERTLHFAEAEGACVDLVGRGNVVVEQEPRLRIRLLDYGIFDFARKTRTQPEVMAEMRERLALLERLRERVRRDAEPEVSTQAGPGVAASPGPEITPGVTPETTPETTPEFTPEVDANVAPGVGVEAEA